MAQPKTPVTHTKKAVAAALAQLAALELRGLLYRRDLYPSGLATLADRLDLHHKPGAQPQRARCRTA